MIIGFWGYGLSITMYASIYHVGLLRSRFCRSGLYLFLYFGKVFVLYFEYLNSGLIWILNFIDVKEFYYFSVFYNYCLHPINTQLDNSSANINDPHRFALINLVFSWLAGKWAGEVGLLGWLEESTCVLFRNSTDVSSFRCNFFQSFVNFRINGFTVLVLFKLHDWLVSPSI